MDDERAVLRDLVADLTTSGNPSLDVDKLKCLKKIVRKSDSNIEVAFDLIFEQLKKKHSQIRYSCVLIIDELFNRSHAFRIKLCSDLYNYMRLTCGTRDAKLPPPLEISKLMRDKVIQQFVAWNRKYGQVYKELALAYDYLQSNLNVNIAAVTAAERERREKEERVKRQKQEKYLRVVQEMEDVEQAIEENLQRMNACFEILVPKIEDLFETRPDNVHSEESPTLPAPISARARAEPTEIYGAQGGQVTYKEIADTFGLGSANYRITIDLPKARSVLDETNENHALFETLRECYKLLLVKHLEMLNRWIDSVVKADVEEKRNQEEILKRIIDLKNKVQEARLKSEDLGITLGSTSSRQAESSDSSDEEFEEVPVPEASEASHSVSDALDSPVTQRRQSKKPSANVTTTGMLPASSMFSNFKHMDDGPLDPTLPPANQSIVSISATASASKDGNQATGLFESAPVLDFHALQYWDKKEMQFNTSGIEPSHFFGTGSGDNLVPKETLERLKMRTSYFEARMPKPRHCRTPLPNGKLCPRRDIFECPFHGIIIDRDETGVAIDSYTPSMDSSSSDLNTSSLSSSSNLDPLHTTETDSSSSTIPSKRPLPGPESRDEDLMEIFSGAAPGFYRSKSSSIFDADTFEEITESSQSIPADSFTNSTLNSSSSISGFSVASSSSFSKKGKIREVARRDKKEKKKGPGLVNLKKKETVKDRLEKKLSESKRVRGVNESLKYEEDMKGKDKKAFAW